MQVTKNNESKTKVRLSIKATQDELDPIKKHVVKELGKDAKIPGFRPGTAPVEVIEKNLDPQMLQRNFLDQALTQLYTSAAKQQDIHPVSKPEVNMKKFVPFTELEFEVTTETIGPIKMGDYKNIKTEKTEDTKVSQKEIDEVLASLQTRAADKKEITRAAKEGDEAVIDFKGVDESGQPIQGAEGQDYPLVLGSKSFIPGFEDNLVGVKAGEEKTFELEFPKDYGVQAMAGKKVKFTVSVKKVQEVAKAELDDKLAAKVGPFKNLDELKADVKRQLEHEKKHQSERQLQNEIVKKVVDKSEVEIPNSLVEQQATYNIDEIRRNLTHRGQTYQEFLNQEGKSEEEYKEKVVKPQAKDQVKASLVLSEIAKLENITVTPEELEVRVQMLKGQYKDQAMQAELDKPENRREISSRMITEKVLTKLSEYAEES